MAGDQSDDEILWNKVKRTIKPLKSNRADRFPELLGEKTKISTGQSFKPGKRKLVSSISPAPQVNINLARQSSLLDEPTRKKISKGRLQIDARLDLHGMTQLQAYDRLHLFLENAQEFGNRTVLVITGKGTRGEGILRNAVPRWLEEPGFSRLVSGYHEAAVAHGGSGALYVRVRRKKLSER